MYIEISGPNDRTTEWIVWVKRVQIAAVDQDGSFIIGMGETRGKALAKAKRKLASARRALDELEG